jgi:hypothetical protein
MRHSLSVGISLFFELNQLQLWVSSLYDGDVFRCCPFSVSWVLLAFNGMRYNPAMIVHGISCNCGFLLCTMAMCSGVVLFQYLGFYLSSMECAIILQ